MGEKQYITYEVICNTFLLGLLADGLNQSSTLHEALQESLAGHSSETQIEEILEELKTRVLKSISGWYQWRIVCSTITIHHSVTNH